MIDETTSEQVAQFADAQTTALPGTQGESGPAITEDEERAAPTRTAQASETQERRTMTIAEIETIAIAARAAWHKAEEVHQITREENRNFYANFKKIATHHADRLKQLEAHFEQTEQKMNELILEATQLMAEHQESVTQFNRTTRRLALSGFAMILILLVVMEISWWVN